MKQKELFKEFFQYVALNILGTLGIPSLITEVASGIVMIVFNYIILRLRGNIGVAAYGIVANLSLVVTSIYTGIAQPITEFIVFVIGMMLYKRTCKKQKNYYKRRVETFMYDRIIY